jgi:putative hydrolase of HD superfamily
LVHDLGEIDAGDTFLYDKNRITSHVEERKCIEKTALHAGNSIENLVALWDVQETGESTEAKLLKVVDRLLPFLHNISSQGRAWKENGVFKKPGAENAPVHRARKPGDLQMLSFKSR